MNLRTLVIPAVAGLALLAAACSGGDTFVTPDLSGQGGISATGTGTATGEPDLMVLTVGVSVERESIAVAREDAATAQTAVIDALKGIGVDDDDIQTVGFSINPRYEFTRLDERELVGYIVSNIVTAKVRDLDRAGEAIDAATLAGGDDAVVQGISFGIDDPTALQEEARAEAVREARAQAEQLAQLAGADLGPLISISENSFSPFFDRSFITGFGGAAEDAAASTPIETGQLEISVTVNVLYAVQ